MKYTLLLLFILTATASSLSQSLSSRNASLSKVANPAERKSGVNIPNHWTISINPVALATDELGIYGDYFFKGQHSVGFNIASMYAHDGLKVFKLSPDQGAFPGAVWHGLTARLNYKLHVSTDRRTYFGIQTLYRSIFYRNENFVNYDGQIFMIRRSENARVFGLDGLIGHHLIGPATRFNLEIFYGVGFRYRERKYFDIPLNSPRPQHSYPGYQRYYTITIGLKAGINIFSQGL